MSCFLLLLLLQKVHRLKRLSVGYKNVSNVCYTISNDKNVVEVIDILRGINIMETCLHIIGYIYIISFNQTS